MQKSIWKLAALAGVVGVGSLGVMQAQRGMSRPEGETAQEKPFDDFETGSDLGEATDSVAGSNSADAVGFGQFEPGSGSSNKTADSSDAPTAIRQKSADLSSDPFGADETRSKPEFASLPPRARKRLEQDKTPTRGLDFRTASVEPETTNPKSSRRSADKDDPFGTAPDDFQSSTQPSDTDVSRPAEDSFTPSPEPSTPQEESGRVRLADGDGDKDDSPVEPTAEFGSSKDDNPFADDGPRLFAPAPDARPLKESPSKEEPAPLEPIRQRRPKRPPLTIAENPRDNAPGRDEDNPFESFPKKSQDDAPEVKPQDDAFSGFDRLPEPEKSKPEPKKSEPPVSEDNSPLPDFGAFDEEAPKRALPSGDTPSVSEPPARDEDVPVPALDPFGDSPNPADDTPIEKKVEIKPLDPLPEPEPEPEPEPTNEPPALTAPALTPPEPMVEERTVEEVKPLPKEQPSRLKSQPKAVRLVPPTNDDLAGDATVRDDAPRGPQRPQLSILKQAPPNAVLGKPMIYSIVVKNVGNSPAAQVTVEDRIPRGTRLTGTIPQAEMYNKKLIWKIGTLKPQEQRKIQVRVIPHEAGQIGSVATVNFVAEVASRTMVTSPSLKLNLASPSTANVGGQFTLKFKVTNDGTSNATGIVLRNLIPEQLSHPGGRDLEYEVGSLPAGQSKEVTLQLTAARIGNAMNKAVVTADGNLTAEATAAVKIVGPQLRLSRSGPKKRYLGRPAKYVNRVTNTSGVAIGPVTVVESIPSGLKFVRASDGGQFNQTERTIAWRIDRLAAGETAEVGSELTAMAKGSQVSRVTAAGPNGQIVRVESQTAVTGLAVLSANLTGITGPIPVGETVTLKVRVANRGNRPATGVKVRLALPSELTFVTSEGPVKAIANAGGIQFTPFQQIGPQQEQSVTIVLRAKSPSEEAHLKVLIDADQLSRPLSRDDVLAVIGDSP